MENPATWGPAEHAINDAYGKWFERHDKGYVGLSLARAIADALRDADLLKEN